MPLSRILVLAITATAAVASAAGAQTGTATTSPSANVRPLLIRLDTAETKKVREQVKPAAEMTAAEKTEAPKKVAISKLVAELTEPEAVSIDPRILAELGQSQADRLRRMMTPEAARTVACGNPDQVARELRRVALALSLADTDERWRDAIVRLRVSIGSLVQTASLAQRKKDTSASLTDCGLGQIFANEAQVIEVNMAAQDALLSVALEAGFEPVFAKSDDAVSLLSAIAVSQTEGTNQVAISPVDYFFSNRWRLYVRSTLVVDEEEADEAGGDTASEEPTPEDLADSVKLALLDPFGGPLNVSGGYFAKIPTPFLTGAANGLHHGLFADLRAGLKFVDLPEEKVKLVNGKTSNTPFYQAAAAIRLILPVFKGAPGAENPGGVEVALTGSWNRVADIDASDLFASKDGSPALLERDTRNLHLAIKIDLPDVASLQISGTLWSNSKFDRRFLIGFGLNRKPEAAKAVAATAGGER